MKNETNQNNLRKFHLWLISGDIKFDVFQLTLKASNASVITYIHVPNISPLQILKLLLSLLLLYTH